MIGESCRSGDMIFVWRVDRLTRNIEDHLTFIQEINAKNVDIYSHSEGFSYNSDRLRFIQAIVDATKEAELLGKRVRLANNRKRQRGDERIGTLPYGKKYKFDTERGCNVVVDNYEELQLIARIKALKNTKSLAEIQEHLYNLGILKRGRAWSVNMIRNVR
jgi:DNA invertase Pin-like site-specific DNA recombinase